MDPHDFHSLAERLAGGATAAEYRTAVSRAYYAAFNVGAAHLRNLGFVIGRGAAAHSEVQRCLANAGDPAVAAAASDLGDLHSSRNRADYQLDRVDVEKAANASAVVALAADLIRTLDEAFQGPRRQQLQAAIQTWRRSNGYP